MLHFVSVLKPVEKAANKGGQKPFFGPEVPLSQMENAAHLLDAKCPATAPERRSEEDLRFVSVLPPPFL